MKKTILLMFAVLLLAFTTPVAQTASLAIPQVPMARAVIVDDSMVPQAGLTVQLWRYPERGGDPQLVDESTTALDGRILLFDSSVSTLRHKSSFVHYAVTAYREKEGSITDFGNYDWSARVSSNSFESQDLVLKTQSVDGGNALSAVAISPQCILIAGAVSTPESCGAQCGWHWQPIKTWVSLYTIMGEVHASDSMSSVFRYGVSSSVSLEVKEKIGTQAWSVTGSVTIQNTLSVDVTWPAISGAAYQTLSQFNYQEDSWQSSGGCSAPAHYKVYATGYNGGTDWGSSLGGDNANPASVTSGSLGNWASYLPGSSFAITETNGFQFQLAVTLGNAIGGSVSLTLTTAYNSYTRIEFTVGTQYATYYAYSGTVSGWPVVYWTHTGNLALWASPSSVAADGVSSSVITAQTSNNAPNVVVYFSTTLGTLSSSSCTTGGTGSCSVNIRSSTTGTATITGSASYYSSGQTSVTFTSPLSLALSASPSSVTVYSSSVITAQTSNNAPNVIVSFSTTLGTLSAPSCTTGSSGSCTVSITSSTTGTATITGTASGYSSGQTSVTFSSGGGGGSVAHGTLITMADGSKVPVQNLEVGSSVITYDLLTGEQGTAVVKDVKVVQVETLLTIYTDLGMPFRTDANPDFRLHVLAGGEVVLQPVTEIQLGDKLFHFDSMSWATVTRVTIAAGGQHVMYDLEIEPVTDFIANGYADCPKACPM